MEPGVKRASNLKTFDEDEVKRTKTEPMSMDLEYHPLSDCKGITRTNTALLESMQESLECSVCKGIVLEPTVLTCGHMFCRFCIGMWSYRSITCPICRSYIYCFSPVLQLNEYVETIIGVLDPALAAERAGEKVTRRERIRAESLAWMERQRQISELGEHMYYAEWNQGTEEYRVIDEEGNWHVIEANEYTEGSADRSTVRIEQGNSAS